MEEGGSSGMPPAAIDARLLRFFFLCELKKKSLSRRDREKRGREEIKPSSHFDADLFDFGSNQSEKSVLY